MSSIPSVVSPAMSTNSPAWARVARIVPRTRAEGPGLRFALWFQGCPFRCPGCCNPEMLTFIGGQLISFEYVSDQLRQAAAPGDLEGITLLGGEPFAHAGPAADLAKLARDLGLTVMVFTGFTLEDLRDSFPSHPDRARLLACVDLLVDGPYNRACPEPPPPLGRRWIGSTNQRVHAFRGHPDVAADPRWREPNTLELRLDSHALTINGFPAPSAVGLWKRPTRSVKHE